MSNQLLTNQQCQLAGQVPLVIPLCQMNPHYHLFLQHQQDRPFLQKPTNSHHKCIIHTAKGKGANSRGEILPQD